MPSDLKSQRFHTKVFEGIYQNLGFAILSEMAPNGTPWRTHISEQGSIAFDSLELDMPDPASLLLKPFYLGSGLLSNISDLIAFELEADVRDGCVTTLSKHPFIFLSCSFPDFDSEPFLQDLSFSEFILVGGNSGATRDLMGFASFLESPESLLEHGTFMAPSSLIAPGYSDPALKTLRSLERTCRTQVKKVDNSTINKASKLFKTVSQAKVRFLYGVSSCPFNHIDEALQRFE